MKELHPALLFLGVKTEINAMDCVRMIRAHKDNTLPITILVAPRGKHALGTFDAQAFSHLAIPTRRAPLSKVLQGAKVYIESRRLHRSEAEPSACLGSTVRLFSKPNRIAIRSRRRVAFVRAEEIEWIEAKKNYVRVHVGDKSHDQRKTLSAIERELDPAMFVRIHRSVIVNIDEIQELRPWPTGEYVVLMRNGKELTLSRGYRARFFFEMGLNSVELAALDLPRRRSCDYMGGRLVQNGVGQSIGKELSPGQGYKS
jgi:two-component system LytT family response regulator